MQPHRSLLRTDGGFPTHSHTEFGAVSYVSAPSHAWRCGRGTKSSHSDNTVTCMGSTVSAGRELEQFFVR